MTTAATAPPVNPGIGTLPVTAQLPVIDDCESSTCELPVCVMTKFCFGCSLVKAIEAGATVSDTPAAVDGAEGDGTGLADGEAVGVGVGALGLVEPPAQDARTVVSSSHNTRALRDSVQ